MFFVEKSRHVEIELGLATSTRARFQSYNTVVQNFCSELRCPFSVRHGAGCVPLLNSNVDQASGACALRGPAPPRPDALAGAAARHDGGAAGGGPADGVPHSGSSKRC